jgi:ATP-dependent DNA ligase
VHIANNIKENNKFYKDYLDAGYEGIMLRNPEGPYAKSSTKKSSALRSKNLLKRKEVYDGEYEVVNFTHGTMGKDMYAIVWVCITKEGTEFNVVPNMTYENRYEIYKDCVKNFNKKYRNRLLSIEYRALSDNNVPQHCRGILFRDFV